MTWQLPRQWKQSQQQRLESGVTLFSADGPPSDLDLGSAQSTADSAGGMSPTEDRSGEGLEVRESAASLRRELPFQGLGREFD